MEEHLWVAEVAVARLKGPRGPDADDLLQEARLALCEAALRWDPERAAFATYVWRRARGAALDALRRARRDPAYVPDGAELREPPDPAEREDLRRALAELPPRRRLVLRLFCEEGWGLERAARLLGVSKARVCQIRREALEALRRRLEVREAEMCSVRFANRMRRIARNHL